MSEAGGREEDKKPADQAARINLEEEEEEEKMSAAAAAGQDEDRKPADQAAHINLKVVLVQYMERRNETFFRINRSTRLRKLMNAYCDRQPVDFNAIAFLLDGRRLRGEETPDELEMEDGDEIHAMFHLGVPRA